MPNRLYKEIVLHTDMRYAGTNPLTSRSVRESIRSILSQYVDVNKDLITSSRVDQQSGDRYDTFAFRSRRSFNQEMLASLEARVNSVLDSVEGSTVTNDDGTTLNTINLLQHRVRHTDNETGITNDRRSSIGNRNYFETPPQRIFNPHTAKAIRADVVRQGGSFVVSNGETVITIPTVTRRRGENITEVPSVLRQGDIINRIERSNAEYAEGGGPLSASLDGASQAPLEVMIARQELRRQRAYDIRERTRRVILDDPNNIDSPWVREQLRRDQEVTNRADRARQLAAERDWRNPAFAQAEEQRLNTRTAREEAQYQWARRRENRRNPLARAIVRAYRNRRRNRSLDSVLRQSRNNAGKIVLTAILTAIGAAVKFLSELPRIASAVLKISNQGAKYNVTSEQLKMYEATYTALYGNQEEAKNALETGLGNIHSKLADITDSKSDLEGVARAMFPLSSVVGGQSIDAIIAYGTQQDSDILKVQHAGWNDYARAAFLQATLMGGIGSAKSYNDAFSRNIESFGGDKETLIRLWARWQRLYASDPNKAEDIARQVRDGADFYELMKPIINPGNLSAQQIATNATASNSGKVADELNQVKGEATSVKDAILMMILSALDGLAGFLETALLGILKGLDKSPFFYGRLTDTIDDLRAGIADRNAARLEVTEQLLRQEQREAEINRVKYDTTNVDKRYQVVDALEHGSAVWLGTQGRFMTEQERINYYANEKMLAKLRRDQSRLNSQAARDGDVSITGTDQTSYSAQRIRFTQAAAKARQDRQNQLIDYGAGTSAGQNDILRGKAVRTDSAANFMQDIEAGRVAMYPWWQRLLQGVVYSPHETQRLIEDEMTAGAPTVEVALTNLLHKSELLSSVNESELTAEQRVMLRMVRLDILRKLPSSTIRSLLEVIRQGPDLEDLLGEITTLENVYANGMTEAQRIELLSMTERGDVVLPQRVLDTVTASAQGQRGRQEAHSREMRQQVANARYGGSVDDTGLRNIRQDIARHLEGGNGAFEGTVRVDLVLHNDGEYIVRLMDRDNRQLHSFPVPYSDVTRPYMQDSKTEKSFNFNDFFSAQTETPGN